MKPPVWTVIYRGTVRAKQLDWYLVRIRCGDNMENHHFLDEVEADKFADNLTEGLTWHRANCP